MHAGAFRDDLSHLTTHAPNETRGTFPVLVTRIIGEDPMQIAIVNGGPIEVVTFAFAAIVFAQRDLKRLERFDLRARPVSRFRAGDVIHQLLDVLELSQRRPSSITSPPLRTWTQPHGKRLGKVFRRMSLRVPRRQMLIVFPALWLGFLDRKFT